MSVCLSVCLGSLSSIGFHKDPQTLNDHDENIIGFVQFFVSLHKSHKTALFLSCVTQKRPNVSCYLCVYIVLICLPLTGETSKEK